MNKESLLARLEVIEEALAAKQKEYNQCIADINVITGAKQEVTNLLIAFQNEEAKSNVEDINSDESVDVAEDGNVEVEDKVHCEAV